jgi:hypothetical protein
MPCLGEPDRLMAPQKHFRVGNASTLRDDWVAVWLEFLRCVDQHGLLVASVVAE